MQDQLRVTCYVGVQVLLSGHGSNHKSYRNDGTNDVSLLMISNED